MQTPKHYDKPVTPWDLQKHMESSGNAFVDARRTDAIEYAFRIKDDLLADLIKARHCLDEAIRELTKSPLRTKRCPSCQCVTKVDPVVSGENQRMTRCRLCGVLTPS